MAQIRAASSIQTQLPNEGRLQAQRHEYFNDASAPLVDGHLHLSSVSTRETAVMSAVYRLRGIAFGLEYAWGTPIVNVDNIVWRKPRQFGICLRRDTEQIQLRSNSSNDTCIRISLDSDSEPGTGAAKWGFSNVHRDYGPVTRELMRPLVHAFLAVLKELRHYHPTWSAVESYRSSHVRVHTPSAISMPWYIQHQ
jgi:hypothetical protein